MIFSNSTTLRLINNDLNKLQDSIISLYWSIFSINLGFNDVFTDRYDTLSGIDQASSNYSYNAEGSYLTRPALTNLVITTVAWESSRIDPVRAYVVVEIDTSVSEVFQLGVDITIQVSTDDGSHYSYLSPIYLYQQVDLNYVYTSYIRGDITDLPSYGSNLIKTRVICSLAKNIKVKGLATGVGY